MWQYLALLISATLGLLIIAIIWHIRNLIGSKEIFSMIPLKRILYSRSCNDLKAGDIIYTRSSISSFQEIIIPYMFKHVGIIIEFEGSLYVAESSASKIMARTNGSLIRRKNGVDLFPLDDRLKNAIGIVFISRLNKPLTPYQNERLFNTAFSLVGKKYPSVTYLYLIFILRLPLKLRMYCHIFVYLCLVSIELVPIEKRSAHRIGSFITSISEHKLNNNYQYMDPVQLVYDLECNDEVY